MKYEIFFCCILICSIFLLKIVGPLKEKNQESQMFGYMYSLSTDHQHFLLHLLCVMPCKHSKYLIDIFFHPYWRIIDSIVRNPCSADVDERSVFDRQLMPEAVLVAHLSQAPSS